jgi:putative membrane protein
VAEPEESAARPEPGWERLSPRTLAVRPLMDLGGLLPLLAGLLLLHQRAGSGIMLGVAAAVLAVLAGMVRWLTTEYRITGERVYLRHGLVSRKVRSVARDRVRTVDVSAHLLHRMAGVCRVTIGTGRNALSAGEVFHLDGLTRPDADALRALLLAEVSRAADPPDSVPGAAPESAAGPSTAGPDGPQDTELARFRLGWLRYAPLTMTGLLLVGVLIGTAAELGNAADLRLIARGPVNWLVTAIAALPVGPRVVVILALVAAAYLLVAAAGYLALFWNFRLVRHEAGPLVLTRGLLSVRATSIAASRLRGAEISEPLPLRLAGGARCLAIATGLHVGRGSEHDGSVLSPAAPRAVAHEVAAQVLRAPAEVCSGPLAPHGPAARRRRYARAMAGALLAVALIAAGTVARHGPLLAIPIALVVLVPAAAALAADRYRSLGHRLTPDGWLVTRTGSLVRRRSIIAADAIVGWHIQQSPLQRRRGLITLTAATAAGHQFYAIRDVPVARGLAIVATATGDLIAPFLTHPAAGAAGAGTAVAGLIPG